MSTPDPQTVREIAQQAMAEMAFRYDAVGSVVAARGLDYDEYVATVMAHIDAATIQVSWPDERPQDVRDAALAEVTAELEAANANADEIAEQRAEYREEIMRLRARVRELEAAQDERDGDVRAARCPCGCIGGPDDCTCGLDCHCSDCLTCDPTAHLRRDAAEPEEDHRGEDANECPACSAFRHQTEQVLDVRAVAQLLEDRANGASMAECKQAFNELQARFADRIAALEARDAKAGEF